MKSKVIAISAAMLLVLAVAAWAAEKPNLAGKWTAQDSDTEIKINFKVDGSKVTGTLDNALAGGSTEIKDGKLEGDKVSFYVEREANGNTVKINWTGTISGDEIKFSRTGEGGGGGGGMMGGGGGGIMGGGGGGGMRGGGGIMGGGGGMMGGGGGGGANAEFDAEREKSDTPSKGAAGKWLIKDGDNEIKLVFKVDGGKLTGTLDNSQVPGEIELKGGKVEGDKVSFYVERQMNENAVKINWSGDLSGDKIHFKRESEGGGGGGMRGGGGGMMGGGPGGGGSSEAEFTGTREKSDKPSKGVAGTWLIKDGDNDIKLVFKVDGSKLTGTLDNSQAPGEIEIKDGKVDGDKVSFHVVRQMNNQDIEIPWSGTLSGDEFKFKREAVGGGGGGMRGGGGMGGGGGIMGGGGGGMRGGGGGMRGGGGIMGGGGGGMRGGGPGGGGGNYGLSELTAKRDKE